MFSGYNSMSRAHALLFFIYFLGKFTRVSAENYDEFLKALNVGFILRKVNDYFSAFPFLREKKTSKV